MQGCCEEMRGRFEVGSAVRTCPWNGMEENTVALDTNFHGQSMHQSEAVQVQIT
jgi:hypothetical protein